MNESAGSLAAKAGGEKQLQAITHVRITEKKERNTFTVVMINLSTVYRVSVMSYGPHKASALTLLDTRNAKFALKFILKYTFSKANITEIAASRTDENLIGKD